MDPYKVLGIPPSSSEDETKKAYRQLAQQFHPDRNGGSKEAEEKFKEINEAYQRITSPESFKDEVPHDGGFSSPAPDFINDIFEGLFGAKPSIPVGQNYQVQVTISFEESCFGCTKTVEFDANEQCSDCIGLGAKDGNYNACGLCLGTGHIAQRHGFMQIRVPCGACQGKKINIIKKCDGCNGVGRRTIHKKHDISIPSLRATGNVLRLKGAGEAISGGHHGDLLIRIIVADKPGYIRNDSNIETELTITLREALLGADKEIDTIHGKAIVHVPECTRPSQKLSLKGKGAGDSSSGYGAHILKIKIDFPHKLNIEQRQLVEKAFI